ncbi:hypothetical protein ACHHYP_20709 [Achlya hypogyna]|uniref:Uncharacterized protein n=1 Tax=Achlya hypogyna TaxID=1202772 RepID=A0A1V9YE41_ACHHY|nr:hypothetical protein ACHHYP_20709 [Achlya hypogyna]
MPRGTSFTLAERERILAYHDTKMSARARSSGVRYTLPHAFLQHRQAAPSKAKISQRNLRRLITEPSKGLTSAKRLKFN